MLLLECSAFCEHITEKLTKDKVSVELKGIEAIEQAGPLHGWFFEIRVDWPMPSQKTTLEVIDKGEARLFEGGS